MLLAAPLRGCRHGHRAFLPLSLPTVVKATSPLAATSFPHFKRFYADPAHDARVEAIRNIGIIAHVDAGKTTTTERMLYYSGLSRHLGNVQDGNTMTDFLPMERERGITIQSAAVTFLWPPQQSLAPGQQPKSINLIDTPGHQDFRYEVDRCLPILDGAVCILDAVKGVETHTERVWESAQLSKIPRLIFVNKLDRDGASFKRSCLEVASRLRTYPLICQIPWWNKDEFVGVIDIINLIGMKFSSTGQMSLVSEETIGKENPTLRAEMDKARLSLIETLSEYDDAVMEEFLELEKDVPTSSIKKAIRKLIMDGEAKFSPIFAGASLKNIGVQPLLDGVIDYLPSPLDRPEVEVIQGKKAMPLSKLLTLQDKKKKNHGHQANHQSPITTIGHVFKVVDDPRRGMMSFVRVYHGALNRSNHLYNSNMNAFEKAQALLHVSAKDYQDIQHLSTGQIGALTGLKQARTGDTLLTFPGSHNLKAPEQFRAVHIKTLDTPPAVAFISIEPYTKTASEKIEEALSKLSREDPSIRWSKDEKTDQLILSGMGLLHLEIAQHRLLTHYKIDRDTAIWGDIEVEYSECLLSPVPPHRAVFDRPMRGENGKAACTATLVPVEDHHRHESILESCVERDGNIIHIAIPLPEGTEDHDSLPFDAELVRQQLLNGVIAGLSRGPRRNCPVRKTHVTITFDPETDFFGNMTTGGHITNAALQAVRACLKEAHANSAMGILEPFTNVTIHCPEEASHAIQHDLVSARGGAVLEVRRPEESEADAAFISEGGGIDLSRVYVPPDPYESVQSLRDPKKSVVRMLEIVGKAPLKDMMKYDSQLRSMTGGRHSLQLDPGEFELVTGPREKMLG
ncbi:P-loop containing nucleoside triphosphate hydrolase protein [Neurospora hispaniola]|uniref:P-loop containing nucleoside triphosphate hydrolase protein n=1 Tax=Neurospora hispaniola TaxID=588809 RepID=A0AAJ0MMN3_9PEZI|nr:P-loop containing nucleoside triphosphate hydrolase protein [Neurospora hispaniola]